MIRRRKPEEEDSSLELLLDTMCNTFGGVMFIAISLLVIISMMTQNVVKEIEASQDTATVIEELESLHKIYAELLKNIQLQQEQIKLKKQGTLDKRFQETVLLQQLLEKTKLELAAEMLQEKTLDALLQKTNIAIKDLEKKTLDQKIRLSRIEPELLDVQQKIAKLEEQLRNVPVLQFRTMERSDRAPFFLMMQKDMVYPVGPWTQEGKGNDIDKSVICATHNYQGETILSCRINPGAGIKVLENGVFSPDFQKLLGRIPPKRVPKFFITPGSAKTVYAMREILKQNNIYHGIVVGESDDAQFLFKYSTKDEYEY